MVVVLFEVMVKKEGMQDYLALAAGLKAELAQARGFIRAERFQSLVQEGKLLSLSVWEDMAAVEAWRNVVAHRMSQRQGRAALFSDYRITVAESVRSYALGEREDAPADSNQALL